MATRRTAFAVEQLLSLRFNTPAVKEEARVDQKEEVHAKNSSGFQDQELHKLLNDLNQKFSSDSHEVDERKISPSERKKNGKVSEKKNSKSRGAKKVRSCNVEGCIRLVYFKSGGIRGRCAKHGGVQNCKVEGCNHKESYRTGGKRGFCPRHGGHPKCQVEGCNHRQLYVKGGIRGFCGTHGGLPKCLVEGCKSLQYHGRGNRRGYCANHGGPLKKPPTGNRKRKAPDKVKTGPDKKHKLQLPGNNSRIARLKLDIEDTASDSLSPTTLSSHSTATPPSAARKNTTEQELSSKWRVQQEVKGAPSRSSSEEFDHPVYLREDEDTKIKMTVPNQEKIPSLDSSTFFTSTYTPLPPCRGCAEIGLHCGPSTPCYPCIRRARGHLCSRVLQAQRQQVTHPLVV